MEPSRLRPIILRLEAMIQDTTDNLQVRRFEVDDVERCKVKYNQETEIFTLNDYTVDIKSQEYDNIDFVAMEIFELTQPVLPEED